MIIAAGDDSGDYTLMIIVAVDDVQDITLMIIVADDDRIITDEIIWGISL